MKSQDMSEIQSDDLEHKMSQWFLRFLNQTSGSLMYQFLSGKVSKDKYLLNLAAQADKAQPAPNLLFASVNYLLMQNPSEPLASFYPNMQGHFIATDEMFETFKKFCADYEEKILLLLKTRLVQTNEIQRCALLLPAINIVSSRNDKTPIALIDVGSSAGLNLLMDKVCIQYSDGNIIGLLDSPLKINCEVLKKSKSINKTPAHIISRIGIDLNPVDLQDDLEQKWALALIWPDQLDRTLRMKEAIKLLERNHVDLRKGNGVQALENVVLEIPMDQTICIMHSFTINQFSKKDIDDFEEVIIASSLKRDVWRISLEWLGTENPEINLSLYRLGKLISCDKIAECHQHGEWIKLI